MMNLVFAHSCIILDASCTINLAASGQMYGILEAIPSSVAVAAYVRDQEALRINARSGEGGTRAPQPIDLQPLVDRGLLISCLAGVRGRERKLRQLRRGARG